MSASKTKRGPVGFSTSTHARGSSRSCPRTAAGGGHWSPRWVLQKNCCVVRVRRSPVSRGFRVPELQKTNTKNKGSRPTSSRQEKEMGHGRWLDLSALSLRPVSPLPLLSPVGEHLKPRAGGHNLEGVGSGCQAGQSDESGASHPSKFARALSFGRGLRRLLGFGFLRGSSERSVTERAVNARTGNEQCGGTAVFAWYLRLFQF